MANGAGEAPQAAKSRLKNRIPIPRPSRLSAGLHLEGESARPARLVFERTLGHFRILTRFSSTIHSVPASDSE